MAVLGLATAGAAYAGYTWYRTMPLEEVLVSGNRHASAPSILRLAALDSVALMHEVNARVVADRVRRHAWVAEAHVRRRPWKSIEIRVREREPVLLALNDSGQPQYYLDRHAFPIPFGSKAVRNVPTLRGAPRVVHPLRPVADDRTRALAADVAQLGDRAAALLSDFEIREHEVWLRTTPTIRGQSVSVRLGSEDFVEKMRRLHAFWHQAIAPQSDRQFQLVDLRFDSQIITREEQDASATNQN